MIYKALFHFTMWNAISQCEKLQTFLHIVQRKKVWGTPHRAAGRVAGRGMQPIRKEFLTLSQHLSTCQ